MPSEQDYIQKIIEMQTEIDEDNELLESAYNKIKELELKLSLANSSHSKKGITDKQVKMYEDRIAELEGCIGLVTEDVLGAKTDEVSSILKQLIKVRSQLSDIVSAKRIRGYNIFKLDDAIAHMEESTAERFTRLLIGIKTISSLRDTEYDKNEAINDVIELIPVLGQVVTHREAENFKLRQEVERLTTLIDSETGFIPKDEADKRLQSKSKEISALKVKIADLEHQLKSK